MTPQTTIITLATLIIINLIISAINLLILYFYDKRIKNLDNKLIEIKTQLENRDTLFENKLKDIEELKSEMNQLQYKLRLEIRDDKDKLNII